MYNSQVIISDLGIVVDRLQTLSVFVAVAEEAGFASAGRRLNMSPPTVTRAVAELEARIGARLLHRTTRSVTLTEAGRRYFEDCQRILSDLEEADRHVAGIHAAPSGLVNVTASVLFGRMVVAPALLDLLDLYPAISLSTFFVDRVVHVVDEGMDVAVRIAELPDSSLTAIRVGSVRRVLCAAPDYLDEHGRPRHLGDLNQHDIVTFSSMTPGVDWAFDVDGRRQSYKPQSRLLTNTADVAINAALANRGITRVLSYMIATHVASGALEIVLEEHEPPPVPVHVVHKEAGHTTARVRAVVDHLVDRLRKSDRLDR